MSQESSTSSHTSHQQVFLLYTNSAFTYKQSEYTNLFIQNRSFHTNNQDTKPLRDAIGLYRDVWIAAIASSTTSLATQTAAICVRFQGQRVRRVYVTMQITFLTRKSALIYRRGLRQRVASLTLNCNGDFAIRAYAANFIITPVFSFLKLGPALPLPLPLQLPLPYLYNYHTII